MKWCGVMVQRAVVGVVYAVAGSCAGLSSAAVLTANPSAVLATDAQDAADLADLADASADSPVQRALSAIPLKTSAGKTASLELDSKLPATPLHESMRLAAKDLALNMGAVDAKQYLREELGLDNTLAAATDGDGIPALPHRASDNNAPPRSAEQLKLDGDQASFLALALVQEVLPWAIGAAVLLGCVQGLRLMLAFSRRRATRKRKYRKSSRSRTPRNARL